MFPDVIYRDMQAVEHLGEYFDRRLEFFRDDVVGAKPFQLVHLRHIPGASEYIEVWIFGTGKLDDPACGRCVAYGYDEDACGPDAQFMENFDACPIAVKDGFALSLRRPDRLAVELQDDIIDPRGTEDPGQVAAIETEPDDDDVITYENNPKINVCFCGSCLCQYGSIEHGRRSKTYGISHGFKPCT